MELSYNADTIKDFCVIGGCESRCDIEGENPVSRYESRGNICAKHSQGIYHRVTFKDKSKEPVVPAKYQPILDRFKK